MGVLWTYQDHAFRAETTGFILYGVIRLEQLRGIERGRRERREWLAGAARVVDGNTRYPMRCDEMCGLAMGWMYWSLTQIKE